MTEWTEEDHAKLASIANKLRSVNLMITMNRADQGTWMVLAGCVEELDEIADRIGEALEDRPRGAGGG